MTRWVAKTWSCLRQLFLFLLNKASEVLFSRPLKHLEDEV